MRALLVALALLIPVAANAQPTPNAVKQTGTVTTGHAAVWGANGVIRDGGTAASGNLTTLGVTNNGNPGFCLNSAAITAPYNQFCLTVGTSSAAKISLQNLGGASAQALQFVINGTTLPFPSGSSGDIVTTAASQAMTNKTYNGLTVTSTTGTLNVASGKTLKWDNTIEIAGTDSTKFTLPVNNGLSGQYRTSSGTSSSAETWVTPGIQRYCITGVNFNSANTDNAVQINQLGGAARWNSFRIWITNASASLSGSTAGAFTATGGGGQTLAASQSVTVTATTAGSNNNLMNMTLTNTNTEAYSDTTVYFRVGTAVGSPATADVCFMIMPMT